METPKRHGLMSLSSNSGNRRAVGKKVGTTGPLVGAPQLDSWMKLAFDEQFTDRRRLWAPVNTKGWRPHAMGEPCNRLSVLGMFGYRGSPIDLKLRRIFDMGHAVESQWRSYFQTMGVLINANVKVHREADPVVNGEYDVLLRHASEPARKLLGDIKSINNNGFSKLPPVTMDAQHNQEALMNLKGTQLYDRCRKYVMQLQVYLRLTGIGEGFILFSNKDNSDFADYYLVQDPKLVEDEFDRLRLRDTYRSRLMVPPCSCVFAPKKSDKKPYDLCWYHTDEEIPLDALKEVTVELGLT